MIRFRLVRLRVVGGGFGGVELGHLGDELVDEDLEIGGDVLELGGEVVVTKERGDGDEEASDGGDERGGEAGGRWR